MEINESNYYNIPALSASQIKDYKKSPYEFWKRSVYNPNIKKKESKSMTLGQICHMLLLEPEKFDQYYVVNKECYDKRTTVGKQWFAEQTKEVVSLSDYNNAKQMIESLYKNKSMSNLLKGVVSEKPFCSDIGDGFKLKGKLDGIKRLENDELIIIDYKTTSEEDFEKWRRYNTKSGHDIQMAIYQQLCFDRYGKYASHMIFLVQSTREDYNDMFDVFEYDVASLDRALNLVFGYERNVNFIIENGKIADRTPDKTKDLIYNCKKDLYEYIHEQKTEVFDYFDGNIKIMDNTAREFE